MQNTFAEGLLYWNIQNVAVAPLYHSTTARPALLTYIRATDLPQSDVYQLRSLTHAAILLQSDVTEPSVRRVNPRFQYFKRTSSLSIDIGFGGD